MSNENTILDNLDKVSPEAMTIANHDVNKQHGNVVWKNMVEQGQDLVDRSGLSHHANQKEFYEGRMREFEEEILAIRFVSGEDVQTKNGDWKYSKVSQNSSYRSNKSVIAGAIGEGIDLTEALMDDGVPTGERNPVPKSKLEKLTKASKSTTITPPTPYERAVLYVTKLKNVYPELDAAEQADVQTLIAQLGATITEL